MTKLKRNFPDVDRKQETFAFIDGWNAALRWVASVSEKSKQTYLEATTDFGVGTPLQNAIDKWSK